MDSFKKIKMLSRKNLQGLRPAFSFQASLAAVCQDIQSREDQASDFSREASAEPRTWEASTQPVASPRSPPQNRKGNFCSEMGQHREEGVPSYTNQAKLNLALERKRAFHPAFKFILASLQMLFGSR